MTHVLSQIDYEIIKKYTRNIYVDELLTNKAKKYKTRTLF